MSDHTIVIIWVMKIFLYSSSVYSCHLFLISSASVRSITILSFIVPIFPGGSGGKESAYSRGDWIRSLGQEDPLEKGLATHSSIIAWRIPWTEEPDGLQSTVLQRVGHN